MLYEWTDPDLAITYRINPNGAYRLCDDGQWRYCRISTGILARELLRTATRLRDTLEQLNSVNPPSPPHNT